MPPHATGWWEAVKQHWGRPGPRSGRLWAVEVEVGGVGALVPLRHGMVSPILGGPLRFRSLVLAWYFQPAAARRYRRVSWQVPHVTRSSPL